MQTAHGFLCTCLVYSNNSISITVFEQYKIAIMITQAGMKLEDLGVRWGDNIKIYMQEIGTVGVDRIDVVQYKGK